MTGKEESDANDYPNLPSKMYEDCFYIRRTDLRLNGERKYVM